MDAIFEFIFGNMFLVILIISGIIGMLSSNKEKQKKQQHTNRPQQSQQQRQPRPRQSASPSRTETRTDSREVVVTAHTEPEEITITTATAKSIGEEQQAQIERLQRRSEAVDMSITEGNVIGEGDFFSEQQLQTLKHFSEEQQVLKKDIRRSLRNKGLINGIIMAEVLGRPRSLKPYQSVTSERFKR